MTLHTGTSNSCTLTPSTTTNSTLDQFSGSILGTNCDSTATADAGCGISDTNTTSFGYGFNDAGGGVYALEWDPTAGISMWHFTRSTIPADITSKTPTPSGWGTPAGFWGTQTCDIAANFYQHSLIIDITLCGNWAGDSYSSSGCPGTCSDMIANATNFVGESVDRCFLPLLSYLLDAMWRINYLAVYQYN